MFGYFRKSLGPSSTTDNNLRINENVEYNQASEGQDSSTPTASYEPISIDFVAEVGGGKGWPQNVTRVLYHQHQSYLCAGSSSGAVYVFGENFQYVCKGAETAHYQSSDVTFLGSMFSDRLIVSYSNNVIACFDVPKLNIICLLEPSWLSSTIAHIYIDEAGLRPYIYVTSSDGTIHVLEMINDAFRVCDYEIQSSKVNQVNGYLTCMQICPKDEKYIALGYENDESKTGSVVLFDFVKNKVVKQFASNAIRCLSWTHVGDFLYAGSSLGDLYSLQLDRLSFGPTIYNSKHSLYEPSEDIAIGIKKLIWLAPQPATVFGCLFVQLDLDNDQSDDGMQILIKEVIVALAPVGKGGDLKKVFDVPITNFSSCTLLDFQIVPVSSPHGGAVVEETRTRSESTSSITSGLSSSVSLTEEDVTNSSPGILFLVQRKSRNLHIGRRHLRIMPLPRSSVVDWYIDQSILQPPRKLWLTTSGSGNVTSINASKPATFSDSFVNVLVKNYKAIARENDNRLSLSNGVDSKNVLPLNPPYIKAKIDKTDYLIKRKFDMDDNEDDDEDETLVDDEELAIDLVTSKGAIDRDMSTSTCDVVFVGQDDGYVVCWGVSRPADISVNGRNNLWVPLLAIKNGYHPITCISYEDSSGLFVVAESTGKLLIWEVYDSLSGIGCIQRFKSNLEDSATYAQKSVNIPLDNEELQTVEESQFGGESVILSETSFDPNSIRYHSKIDLNINEITKVKILPDIMIVVVGTLSGQVYTISLYDEVPKAIQANLSSFGRLEAVTGLHYSTYCRPDTLDLVPAVYVSFQSDIVIVLHPITHDLLAYTGGPPTDKVFLQDDEEDEISSNDSDLFYQASKAESSHSTAFSFVLNGSNFIVNTNIDALQVIKSCARPSHQEEKLATAVRKSVLPTIRFLRQSIDSTSITTNSDLKRTNSAGSKLPIPNEYPQTLLLLSGRRLLTYNLQKFIIPKKNGQNLLTVASSQVVTSKPICTTNIISASIVNYIEEAMRAFSDPLPCLLMANAHGGVLSLRLYDKTSVGHIDLFDKILPYNTTFTSGVVLRNGDCYFHSCGALYSARASSVTHISSEPLPHTSTVSSFEVVPAQLLTGRDLGNKKKKRTIIITSVTDLDKIFMKTKEQRMKDDLFESNTKDKRGDEATPRENKQVRIIESEIKATQNVMLETKEVLEERGEKLELLDKRSAELQNTAQEYEAKTKAAVDTLKKKHSRWTIFS